MGEVREPEPYITALARLCAWPPHPTKQDVCTFYPYSMYEKNPTVDPPPRMMPKHLQWDASNLQWDYPNLGMPR